MTGDAKRLRYVDGWCTEDPQGFRVYVRDRRSWGYRSQLALDIRSWKPWAWWLAAVAPLVAAALRGVAPTASSTSRPERMADHRMPV